MCHPRRVPGLRLRLAVFAGGRFRVHAETAPLWFQCHGSLPPLVVMPEYCSYDFQISTLSGLISAARRFVKIVFACASAFRQHVYPTDLLAGNGGVVTMSQLFLRGPPDGALRIGAVIRTSNRPTSSGALQLRLSVFTMRERSWKQQRELKRHQVTLASRSGHRAPLLNTITVFYVRTAGIRSAQMESFIIFHVFPCQDTSGRAPRARRSFRY